MVKRSRFVAAMLIVVLTACSSPDDQHSGDRVTYVTASGALGRDAFVWVAQEKGFFREAGIVVDIQKGAGNVQNLTMIRSGQAQFAALDFTGAVVQAGQGRFTEWRAIAAVHQQTLVSIMTTGDTGITKAADLKGRTIGTASGSVGELLFPAYAKLAGLDPATVKIQGAPTTALNGLMAGRKVDALSTFLLGRKALETASKKPVTVLPYNQYLKGLYGNAIIARTDVISGRSDLVKRFAGAAMKGLQYTIDHPQEAAEMLHTAEPTSAVPAAAGEIEAMKPFVAPIGELDDARIAEGIAELEKAGLIRQGLQPDQVADFSVVAGR